MRSLRRRLAPPLAAGVLALLVAVPAEGVDWSDPVRVSRVEGSALSALHELAAAGGRLHLVHGRQGPGARDDRVVYQRSATAGASWSRERRLFTSTAGDRVVVPNLAIGASGRRIVVAWRTRGPAGATLWIRRSTDGGTTWAPPRRLFHGDGPRSIGTPAIAVERDTLLVGWTDRATGRVLVRRSGDGGVSFGQLKVIGRTDLSIECRDRVIDGLVGLAASEQVVHVAWSEAKAGSCIADRLLVRTSRDDGVTFKPERVASRQRSYGWPELAARGDRLLVGLQRPDGAIVLVRSTDGGRSFTERLLRPGEDRALGAADVLLPTGRGAWIVYADVAYRGGDVAGSQVRFRSSSDGGRTWSKPRSVVGYAAKLREATNLAAVAGDPVVTFTTGPADGSATDIVAVHAR